MSAAIIFGMAVAAATCIAVTCIYHWRQRQNQGRCTSSTEVTQGGHKAASRLVLPEWDHNVCSAAQRDTSTQPPQQSVAHRVKIVPGDGQLVFRVGLQLDLLQPTVLTQMDQGEIEVEPLLASD